MRPLIEIRGLSKQYDLGERRGPYDSLRELLMRALVSGLRGREPPRSFWALRDVSFDVHQGDVVGILGANGAGKTTLLKIIARITDPTEGYVRVRGRTVSLLEVGTGFHPELTGRENVYLNGAILGMRKREIEARFEEIAAFAGIGKFLDTPVKRYSSGMYVRLAFSIAAHMEPDILLADEVLAVGDAAFQKKCLGKMAEARAHARSVLFVSHNVAAIENLCNRAVVIEHGAAVFMGTAREAIRYYLESGSAHRPGLDPHVADLSASAGRPPEYRPLLRRLELFTAGHAPLQGPLPMGAPLQAVLTFDLEEPCTAFDVLLAFDTVGGQRICTAQSAYDPERAHEERVGEQSFVCEIESLPMLPGEYKLHAGLHIGGAQVDWVEDAARVRVVRSDYYGAGSAPGGGVFLLEHHWRLLAPRQAPARPGRE